MELFFSFSFYPLPQKAFILEGDSKTADLLQRIGAVIARFGQRTVVSVIDGPVEKLCHVNHK